jgi:hypothetical protein
MPFLLRTGCEQIKQSPARKGGRHTRHSRCASRVGGSDERSRSQSDILKSDKGKRGNNKIDGVKIRSGSNPR